MEEVTNTQMLEPRITEKRLWNLHNVFLAFFITVGFIAFAFLLIVFSDFELTTYLIIMIVLIVVYATILFFLLEPKILREVESTVFKTVERPVIKEVEVEKKVFIDRPVDREVIREVEVPVEKKVFIDRPVDREVIREVEVPVEKKVYVQMEKPRKRLKIPRYDFVASSETQTYHTRNCRFGKLIKRKYKLSSNDKRDFIKKKFKPCKVCIKKEKKI
jgi:hypothetical protein